MAPCTGTTKSGKSCKAQALRGTQRCGAHPVDGETASFGTPEQSAEAGRLGGRPRKPKVTDVIRERVEAEAEEIVAVYFEQLRKAVHVAKHEGAVYASEIPDLGARLEAAEKLLDRVYGKPKQATEITGPDGDHLELREAFGDPAVRQELHELKRRVADARGMADRPSD